MARGAASSRALLRHCPVHVIAPAHAPPASACTTWQHLLPALHWIPCRLPYILPARLLTYATNLSYTSLYTCLCLRAARQRRRVAATHARADAPHRRAARQTLDQATGLMAVAVNNQRAEPLSYAQERRIAFAHHAASCRSPSFIITNISCVNVGGVARR